MIPRTLPLKSNCEKSIGPPSGYWWVRVGERVEEEKEAYLERRVSTLNERRTTLTGLKKKASDERLADGAGAKSGGEESHHCRWLAF